MAKEHGNCATATVNTVVLRKFRTACISKITVEIPFGSWMLNGDRQILIVLHLYTFITLVAISDELFCEILLQTAGAEGSR